MHRLIKQSTSKITIKRLFAKYYDKNHVWITKVEGEDMYSMGIGSQGLKDLGELRSVKFGNIDLIYHPETTVVVLEGFKTTREIKTPVTFYLEKLNQKVKDDPNKFIVAPENVWLVWGELQAPDEIKDLMTVDQYADYVEQLNKSRKLKRKLSDHISQERQM